MRADAEKNYRHLLEVAGDVVTTQGADASLRDIARRAGVGLGTLYRHFPTREALLEALLRVRFDELTAKAEGFNRLKSADEALVAWLHEAVAVARKYRGVTSAMMAAIEDSNSALHSSCVTMRAAGTRLLLRAQAEGMASAEVNGVDLFALVAALAWLGDQPSLAPRAEHLFGIITAGVLTRRAGTDVRGKEHPRTRPKLPAKSRRGALRKV
jgi:AcrR family transcriptional regulator